MGKHFVQDLFEKLDRIIDLLESLDRKTPNRYTVRITKKENHDMAGTTIQVGGAASFEAELLDNGAAVSIPAGSTWAWSSADPLATLTPLLEADGVTVDPTGITVNIAGSDTQTSLVLNASTVDPTGATDTGNITVPVTPEPQVFTVKIVEN